MHQYYYSIGPFVSDEDEQGNKYWRAPDTTVGLIDLAKNSDFATSPDQPRGVGFFASTEELGVGYTQLNATKGDLRELAVDSAMQDAWETATGYRPSGALLIDLLADHLTTGADIDGETQTKPLIPGTNGELAIHLGGHSKVWSRRMTASDPHMPKYLALLKKRLAIARVQARAGKLVSPTTRKPDTEYHRKVADSMMEKLARMGVTDFEKIRPTTWPKSERPIKHETTITDNFNRADADAMGTSSGGWSWTEVAGDIDIAGNQCAGVTGGSDARAETDLSSDDHYAQVRRTDSTTGVRWSTGAVRFDPSANTNYHATWRGGGFVSGIFKRIEGAFTELTNDNTAETEPHTYRMEADGSTITALRDGVIDSQTTDVSIEGFLRTGLYCVNSGSSCDDFEAGDLAASTVVKDIIGVGIIAFPR